MLTPFDDDPIHQTLAPIAQPTSADPGHHDRYLRHPTASLMGLLDGSS